MNWKEKGFATILFLSICILIISLLPYYKTLFVAETGRFDMLGKGWGCVFILCLFARWKKAINIILLVYSFNAVLLSTIAINGPLVVTDRLPAYIVYILLHVLVVLILCLSKDVKKFMNGHPESNYSHPSETL